MIIRNFGLLAALTLLASPLSAMQLGEVRLERCELGGSGLGEAVAAQCASLDLPADPDLVNAGSLSIRIAVVPARDAHPAPDALLFIAGGPGQSALESYPQVAAALDRINQSRHIVLVDQRGTGASARLSCSAVASAEQLVDEPANPADLRQQTEQCLAELKYDPRWFTTSLAVADLEAVRQRLAIQQFNVYGVSYGTRVAQVYMRTHPTALRSVILDGVVPADLLLGSNFGQQLDTALQKISASCEAEPRCAERFPDPLSALRVLKAQLSIQPVQIGTTDPRSGEPISQRVDAERLAGLVRLYAYGSETQSLLPLLIETAGKGHLGPLLAQSLMLGEELEGSLSQGMQLSVLCSEDIDLLDAPSPAERESLLGAGLLETLRSQCSVWPRGKRPDDFHTLLHSAIPTLLLSGEFDPVTPPEYAERTLRGLSHGRHLVARGQGHNVLPRGCLPRLAHEFIESADVAALDVKCLEQVRAAPFFLNFNGTAP